jgi:YggT family protein
MGGGYGTDALQFLIRTLVDLYVVVVLLRFALQAVRADYFNPVAQFVVQATRPVLAPMRRLLPPAGRYDYAALLLALALMWLKIGLYGLLSIDTIYIGGYVQPIQHVWIGGLLWIGVVDLIALILDIGFFAVLIMAILSWIAPAGPNPVMEMLRRITDPLIRPVRRVIPLIGGVDLSPLVVLIGLQLLKMLLLRPLLVLA